jgi:hypothetical protein
LYYEHKAMTFSVLRFGDDWAISVTPCYAFTRDGDGKPIGRDRINALSTRRAARDFNPSVYHDVAFWVAVISEDSQGVFVLRCEDKDDLTRFAPTILLSSRLPTISFNTLSFDTDSKTVDETDADLGDLEKELAALAEEDSEQETDQSDGD